MDNIDWRPISENGCEMSTLLERKFVHKVAQRCSGAYSRALSRGELHTPNQAAMSVDRFLNQFLLVDILAGWTLSDEKWR